MMPATSRNIEIIKTIGDVRQPVMATLIRDVDHSIVDHVEGQWKPLRRLLERNPSWEHSHWDWNLKIESDTAGELRLIAVTCEESVQGMMAIRNGHSRCPRTLGQRLIYVDYLETAPWNLKGSGSEIRYASVGTVLTVEAVCISLESGCEGRIGLHSLPGSRTFYREFLKMTDFGPDHHYQNLHYFEYNANDARSLLNRSEP